MQLSSLSIPTKEGVFGPELLLNSRTGRACFRLHDGTLIGEFPSKPITNAFLVWVDAPVLVVSEGVEDDCERAVAEQLRQLLAAPKLSIVFNKGRHPTGHGVLIVCDSSDVGFVSRMAKAEAYVLVQCAWEEDEAIVHVGDERIVFRVSFQEVSAGSYRPVVREVDPQIR